VPSHLITLSVLVQVVPEDGRSLFGEDGSAKLSEDGRAAQVHVRDVAEPGGDAIAGA
jgi:hypothetical protein